MPQEDAVLINFRFDETDKIEHKNPERIDIYHETTAKITRTVTLHLLSHGCPFTAWDVEYHRTERTRNFRNRSIIDHHTVTDDSREHLAAEFVLTTVKWNDAY